MFLSSFRSSRSKSDDSTAPIGLRQRASNSSLASGILTRPRLVTRNSGRGGPQDDEPDLRDLNKSLIALAELFPDVRPDVLREMLSSLSEESRLHVVADQLLNNGAKWIQGRWRITSKVSGSKILGQVLELEGREMDDEKELVPLAEQFRATSYKNAVRSALEDEFRNLSRTAIDGVLAEQNFSYTHARPVLAGLAAKSWRISIKSLMKWKKAPETHFMLLPARNPSAGTTFLPQIKKTGCAELDEELQKTVLQPLWDQETNAKAIISQELAILLNNADAQENQAIYECECCFDEVAFESVTFCSTGQHTLCFTCVQNTISAALYAQAWSKTVDQNRSALSCFAPSSDLCEGIIPNYLTERALSQTRGGSKTWQKFEEKLALDARRSAGTKFHDCPCCNYAEVDDVYWPPGLLSFRFKGVQQLSDMTTILSTIVTCIPLLCLYFLISLFVSLPQPKSLFEESKNQIARKNCLSRKFICRNPSCSKSSCRLCKAIWRDEHKCNEKEEVSLRTSIEAAKSAATKRVCPKCNLSFVKASGCNKMTCTCGYTMCYLCRQGLGQSANKDNPHNDHDYSHFCGHFRAFPGRCMQCDKCDLYREGNQEEIVKKAGEAADKEWRAKKKKRVSGADNDVDDTMEARIQTYVNQVVEVFITC